MKYWRLLSVFIGLSSNVMVAQDNALIEDLTISVDLNEGWNIVGYTCQYEKDAILAFSSITSNVVILKNNNGQVYMPEFGFNGIGNLIPGYGYQLKLNEAVINFSFNSSCFSGCMSSWAENYMPSAFIDDGSCYLYGCTESWADNFNVYATIENNYCYKAGCMDTSATNYDFNATLNDSCIYWNPNLFSQPILSSYENMTLGVNASIINQFEGGQFGVFYDINEDLILECLPLSTILNGFFGVPLFGDNTEYGRPGLPNEAVPIFAILHEGNVILVEPEPSFPGYETNGIWILTDANLTVILACGDTTVGNDFNNPYTDVEVYNQGSCEYDQTILDDSIQIQIGDLAEGGIVFYVDESGEHGLVAGTEDVIEGAYEDNSGWGPGFEWGCFGDTVLGASSVGLGEGYDNTIAIIGQGCQTENGGATAAQACVNYESGGYGNWYLPSFDELFLMYSSIGQGSQINVGNFASSFYWSSTEGDTSNAYFVHFPNGNSGDYADKNGVGKVRAIRSF